MRLPFSHETIYTKTFRRYAPESFRNFGSPTIRAFHERVVPRGFPFFLSSILIGPAPVDAPIFPRSHGCSNAPDSPPSWPDRPSRAHPDAHSPGQCPSELRSPSQGFYFPWNFFLFQLKPAPVSNDYGFFLRHPLLAVVSTVTAFVAHQAQCLGILDPRLRSSIHDSDLDPSTQTWIHD